MKLGRIHRWAAALGVCSALALGSQPARAQPAPCGPVTVGKSGIAKECSTASLQVAIERATDPADCYDNEVWITNDLDNRFFDRNTITINNQIVKIVGGYVSANGDGCKNLVRTTNRSIISGAGGVNESVFTVRGASDVTMDGLEIVGGDEDGTDGEGGGIDFKGRGGLILQNTVVRDGIADSGGGVYARGEGGSLTLILTDGTSIFRNSARENGGGIHISGSTYLDIVGNGINVGFNKALGTGVEGQGGGLYVRAPADARVRAHGLGGSALFNDNSARHGGAIALRPSEGLFYNVLRISSFDGSYPVILQTNRATLRGAGIFSDGLATTGNAPGEVSFCAFDTAFIGNRAPRGTAIYSDWEDSLSSTEAVQGPVYINACNVDVDDLRRCPADRTCSEFRGNHALEADGSRSTGDIIELPAVDDSDSTFEIRNTLFRENVAGSIIYAGDANSSTLRVFNSMFSNNNTSAPIIDSDAGSTRLRHITLFGNQIGAAHALRVVESGDGDPTSRSSLVNSIIHQPGKLSLDHVNAREQSWIEQVLASEIVSLQGGALRDHASIVAGDPQFSEIASGVYEPAVTSPAIDRGSALDEFGQSDRLGLDMRGRARNTDLPGIGNEGSFYRDLGAIERQPTPDDPRPDPVFCDHFEDLRGCAGRPNP